MQVFLGDELVGELNVDEGRVGEDTFTYVWHEMPEFVPRYADPSDPIPAALMGTRRHVTMTVAKRSVLVDQSMAYLGDKDYLSRLLREAKAPNISAITREFDSFDNRTRYSWRVLKVTPEQLETLFDLDDFEMEDTEPDYDQISSVKWYAGTNMRRW